MIDRRHTIFRKPRSVNSIFLRLEIGHFIRRGTQFLYMTFGSPSCVRSLLAAHFNFHSCPSCVIQFSIFVVLNAFERLIFSRFFCFFFVACVCLLLSVLSPGDFQCEMAKASATAATPNGKTTMEYVVPIVVCTCPENVSRTICSQYVMGQQCECRRTEGRQRNEMRRRGERFC